MDQTLIVPEKNKTAPLLPIEWVAPEFPSPRRSLRVLFALVGVCIAIVVFALVKNSPIMAITFVLLGTLTVLHSQKTPSLIECAITWDAVHMGREEYAFEHIKSFWVVYDESDRCLFLKTNGVLVSSVRVPLGEMNSSGITRVLPAISSSGLK